MDAKRKRRKKVDRDEVLQLRKDGRSYAEIGKKFGISESGAYYAANPRKRVRQSSTSEMRTSSFYLPRPVWMELRMAADDAGVTMSALAGKILTGAAPALDMTPRDTAAAPALVSPGG